MSARVCNDDVPELVDRLQNPCFASSERQRGGVERRLTASLPCFLCSVLLTDLLVEIVEILRVVEFDVGATLEVLLDLGEHRQLSFDALLETLQLFVQLEADVYAREERGRVLSASFAAIGSAYGVDSVPFVFVIELIGNWMNDANCFSSRRLRMYSSPW